MADEPYDAHRDRGFFRIPFDAVDPDVEPPETNEDRYRDVLNDEAERLPPELEPQVVPARPCVDCGLLATDEEPECDGCASRVHEECRTECERCNDRYCYGCRIGEICSGCYDDLRAGEYSRGGATREV